MTFVGLSALCLLLALLVGYSFGRRTGYTHGLEHGRADCRIELREQSMRRGVCPTCDRS